MTDTFKIPIGNPFNFVNRKIYDERDIRYNTFPIDYPKEVNPNGPYFQPWQLNDFTKFPIYSSYDIELNVYNFCDDTLYKNIPLVPLDIIVLNETFKIYEPLIDFRDDWDEGMYYLAITYNSTPKGSFNAKVIKATDPGAIDGNLQVEIDGNEIINQTVTGTSDLIFAAAGKTYQFNGYSTEVPTTANPRIRLTVTKTLNAVSTIVFDKSEIDNGANSIIYTGTVQPGASYACVCITEDTAVVVDPINIPDDAPVVQIEEVVQSSPLDLRVKHFKTLLYEYSNTRNDKGIIFTTGLTMSVRIQGLIREYTPKAQTQDYIDQKYDTESLNDIPYGTHVNYIGSARGLPDWFIKKMNTIFTLNTVNIEGYLFNKVTGQEFAMTRPTNGENEEGYASIQIIQNFNDDLTQYETGNLPNPDFVVIQKVIQYYNNAANIAVAGIFKIHSRLVGLAIVNTGENAFTLKAGISNGGNEIGEYEITDDLTTWVGIDYVFKDIQSVYFTGLDGTNLDIDIDYKDYDAPQSDVPVNTGGFVENVEYTYYERNIGDFDRDWSAGTGLGNPDTVFENCRLLTGQNGTIDDTGLSRIGWDRLLPSTRGTVIGAANNFIELSKAELPPEGIAMIDDSVNGAAGDTPTSVSSIARARAAGTQALNYELVKGRDRTVFQPTLGLTANLGEGDPIDITPESLVIARFIYVKPA